MLPWILRCLALGLALGLGACSPRPAPGTVGLARPPYDAAKSKAEDLVEADQVRANLNELRARRGRSAALPFPVVDGYLADAKKRIERGRDPSRALDAALQTAADEGDRDIRCWSLVTHDLNAVKFPSTLLTSRDLHAGITVIHRQATDGTARDEYIVLVAMSVDYLEQSGPVKSGDEQ